MTEQRGQNGGSDTKARTLERLIDVALPVLAVMGRENLALWPDIERDLRALADAYRGGSRL